MLMAIRLKRRTSPDAALSKVKYTAIKSTDEDNTPDGVQSHVPTVHRSPKLLKVIAAFVVVLFLSALAYHTVISVGSSSSRSDPDTVISSTNSQEYVSCYSARGKLLTESPDDSVEEKVFKGADASVLDLGTYRDLPLKRTWSTPDGRYGPYGRGENAARSTYRRTVVPWHQVDWAQLQNNCTVRNSHRFDGLGPVVDISLVRRMTYPTDENSQRLPPRPAKTTGRTAIVLRAWEEFVFHDLDSWSLRALITETALTYGGDYAVFLLVDMHESSKQIFRSSENYEAALDRLVPREFRNMTVLFDQSLLEAWYPKTPDHKLGRQIWQPMQLFARFFNEFDHYWQLEMDIRFTGHTGRILEGLSTFARNEPRKQARERSSFSYSENTYHRYSNLTSAVNEALGGGSSYWSGIPIPDLDPIGPEPPVAKPEDDNFKWGVGEDADAILLGPCHNLTRSSRTDFKQYVHGFQLGRATERLICAPAAGRSSWNLLNEIHTAQFEKGLAVPSEATPASFAMWLNLKISRPPFPMFLREKRDPVQLDLLMNGGRPTREKHGIAHSMGLASDPTNRRKHGVMFDSVSPTWRPSEKQAGRVFDDWLEGSTKKRLERPLIVRDRAVWMTNTLLHPVKTNEDWLKAHHKAEQFL